MKAFYKSLAVACVTAICLTACTKEAKEVTQDYVSDDVLSKIQSLGFDTKGVIKTNEGYLVERDILLTAAELSAAPTSPGLIIAQEEQYHTFNLVDASEHSTIKIALNNSSSTHQNAFSAALDEAIKRYNAENLSVKFRRVSSNADITVVAFYENSNVLGSAGFPNSSGDPYNQIRMNTYHYSTSTGSTNVNYIGTIIAHEMGHCIGFRHTDYMKRRYSCGIGGNEGQVRNGVGAVHIPGTPTGPDAASWMLACIGDNVNRPFNKNDKVALAYLY
jgi:hypothetical protein